MFAPTRASLESDVTLNIYEHVRLSISLQRERAAASGKQQLEANQEERSCALALRKDSTGKKQLSGSHRGETPAVPLDRYLKIARSSPADTETLVDCHGRCTRNSWSRRLAGNIVPPDAAYAEAYRASEREQVVAGWETGRPEFFRKSGLIGRRVVSIMVALLAGSLLSQCSAGSLPACFSLFVEERRLRIPIHPEAPRTVSLGQGQGGGGIERSGV